MSIFKETPESKKAFELIEQGISFYISGKAGTGKTRLLEEIVKRYNSSKSIAVLAPTGVAAQHAGGVTIHSFLRLPVQHPYFPDLRDKSMFIQLGEDAIQGVRKIDMILLDEVSMVRCDLLDEMDFLLRYYRRNTKPFGDIQIILLGDLYQLMPVAKDDEWEDLSEHYSCPYFFDSDVIKKTKLPMLELTQIFRQAEDEPFMKLLNRVRIDKATTEDIKTLKKKYNPSVKYNSDPTVIRLATHNFQARIYNNRKIKELPGKKHDPYTAITKGYYPSYLYPVKYSIELKVGARVMFVRNDPNKRYVNGTLGIVTYLDNNTIRVKTDSGKTINVEKATWTLKEYTYNKKTKRIETTECGSFRQYPLKLAWCITIHKSQGLTFDNAVIDAGKAFANGQVYVALSRCKTLKGITLASEITDDVIMSDRLVDKYMKEVDKIPIASTQNLTKSKSSFSKEVVQDLLIYKQFGYKARSYFERMIVRHGKSVDEALEYVKNYNINWYNHAIEQFNRLYPGKPIDAQTHEQPPKKMSVNHEFNNTFKEIEEQNRKTLELLNTTLKNLSNLRKK